MATDRTQLENAIETLVCKYYDYAKNEGKHDNMNKKEFMEILKQELQHVLTFTSNQKLAEDLLKSLDRDKDGKISFVEYWKLITKIAQMLSQQMAMQYKHKMPSSQTELEHAIMTIVKCFFDHAGEEGKKETLSINEFIKLTQMELPHLMKDIYLEKMMDLGNNQDSDINFKKFWSLISKKVERDIKPMK